MKTADETVEHLQEIISNIYRKPAMYGGTVGEVENALLIYHSIWAYITECGGAYGNAQLLAAEAAGSPAALSFTTSCYRSHPDAPEHEVLRFVLEHWAMVTERLNIPLPLEYPDQRHAFLPDTS
jgi:hypothetical protein